MSKRHSLLRFPLAVSFSTLTTIVLLGVLGLHYVEGWSWFDSIYMVIITLSTVGYGEVYPLSDTGRLFMSLVLVLGISSSAFFFGLFLQYFSSFPLYSLLKGYRMKKNIQKLHDHCIICGYGRIGKVAYNTLIADNMTPVVIDPAESHLDELEENGALYIVGNASEDNVLLSANIMHASSLIVAISDHTLSAFVILSARKLNPDLYIVTRADSENVADKLLDIGANYAYNPFQFSGQRIAKMVIHPKLSAFMNSAFNGRNDTDGVVFEEVIISKKSSLVGIKLFESDLRSRFNIIIIGIVQESGKIFYNPDPSYTFKANDSLVMTCEREQLSAFKNAYKIA